METKHTPTPWEAYGRLNVRSASGEPVAACGPQRSNTVDSNSINEANVAFIVRACNSHEALVEALESMIAALSPQMVDAHDSGGLAMLGFEHGPTCSLCKVRAALKLAKP